VRGAGPEIVASSVSQISDAGAPSQLSSGRAQWDRPALGAWAHLPLDALVLAVSSGLRYGRRAHGDSVWEQKELEARNMLENAAESPASRARIVGRIVLCKNRLLKRDNAESHLLFLYKPYPPHLFLAKGWYRFDLYIRTKLQRYANSTRTTQSRQLR